MKSIKIEMFEETVHIIDDITNKKDMRKVKKLIGDDRYKDLMGTSSAGVCTRADGWNIIVIVAEDRPEYKTRVLVHELLHAVKRVVENHGVNDEETECYMLDHLYYYAMK